MNKIRGEGLPALDDLNDGSLPRWTAASTYFWIHWCVTGTFSRESRPDSSQVPQQSSKLVADQCIAEGFQGTVVKVLGASQGID
jgi:hypothetical protein